MLYSALRLHLWNLKMHLIQIEWNVWWTLMDMQSIFHGVWSHVTSEFYWISYIDAIQNRVCSLSHLCLSLCMKHRSGKANPHFPYLLHLGIQVLIPVCLKRIVAVRFLCKLFLVVFYHADFLLSCQSYDTQFLKIYPDLPPTTLQLEEDLEQLKVLENGYKMKVSYNHFVLYFDWLVLNSFDQLSVIFTGLTLHGSESSYGYILPHAPFF